MVDSYYQQPTPLNINDTNGEELLLTPTNLFCDMMTSKRRVINRHFQTLINLISLYFPWEPEV